MIDFSIVPSVGISRPIEEAIFNCLVEYWVSLGVDLPQAGMAAHRALDLLRADKGGKTWCISVCLDTTHDSSELSGREAQLSAKC